MQIEHYRNPLYVLRALRDGSPSFFELLTAQLPLDAFENAFAGLDLLEMSDFFTKLVLELPNRLNRVVIRLIAKQARASGGPIWNLDSDIVKSFGHEQVDLLIESRSGARFGGR